MTGRHDHQDAVHPGRPLERGDGMLDHRPARQREQLLEDRRAEALARPSREHYRDRPHDADSTRGAAPGCGAGRATFACPAPTAYLWMALVLVRAFWLVCWPGAIRPAGTARGGGAW